MTNTNERFQELAAHAVTALQGDTFVIGLAAAGSWITQELHEYSDLDLILVTKDKLTNKEEFIAYARRFGNLVSAFTGEHVNEPRLLICLYDDPLLHVDIKFLTLDEFGSRVEDPFLLLDKDEQLANVIRETKAVFPFPEYQWIEDRFWTWIHYLLTKTGRGEYFEASDFLAFLRAVVFGPLLHIRNGNLPRGVRRVEMQLPASDLVLLKSTIATHERSALITATKNAVSLYRQLRISLYPEDVMLQKSAEEAVALVLDRSELSR